jgi:hypothetical protein
MRAAFVFLFILFSFACKEPAEVAPSPVVSVDTPTENAVFMAGNAIRVKGSVTSQIELMNITISLVNTSMTSVAPSRSVSTSAKSALFDEEVLAPASLTPGTYYIDVTVTNAQGTQNRKFVKISLSATNQLKKHYYVISGSSISTTVSHMDSTYLPSTIQTISGKYHSSGLNASQKLLGISFYNFDLTTIDLSDNSVAWSLADFSSSSPTYTGVMALGNYLYVSHAQEGFFRVYDASKNVSQTGYSSLNYNPDEMIADETFIYVNSVPVNTSLQERLSLYYRSTGGGAQEININGTIVSMFPKSADEIFVYRNASGQGEMDIYNITGNSFYSVHAFPVGQTVVEATPVSSDDQLILTGQELFTYRFSNNSLVPYLSLTGSSLVYDNERNEVLLCTGNELRIYDYSSKQLKRTVTFAAPVLEVYTVSF